MKIIYLHQYFVFPTENGGTRSYDLAKKFIEEGHEVEFITTSRNYGKELKKKWSYIETEGIKFNIINLDYNNTLSYLSRIIVFWKFLWYSSFKILDLKGDLVISTSTPLTIGIPALVKKWIHKTPYIFEARDVWPEAVIAIGAIKNLIAKKVLYRLESVIYNNASAIVPLSTDMKNSITERYPNLTCPIEVIENISELERFRNRNVYDFSFIKNALGFLPRYSILYAGTFGKVNGLSYVISLAERLLPIDPSIIFMLIGGGAEREKIIELSKSKNVLKKNVFILESVSKNELPQIYSEVSMGSSFVLPITELWANSANKFFDTLAACKPMLINHKGWQEEVLLKNNAGFILPHDIKQLSNSKLEKFVQYTRDMELQNIQQKNAANLAQNYSLEQASTKYLKIIKNISEL